MDWECGGRDRATLKRPLDRLKRPLDRLKRWRARLCCADGWEACAELLPVGRLFVGKDETHGIERDHARRRHRLARSRRRSIVVSRSVRLIDASIALFAAFGGNDTLHDLVSMLA